MSTIIIITPKPPGGQQLTAETDGTVMDRDGNVHMTFSSYEDAIAYLQHLSNHDLS